MFNERNKWVVAVVNDLTPNLPPVAIFCPEDKTVIQYSRPCTGIKEDVESWAYRCEGMDYAKFMFFAKSEVGLRVVEDEKDLAEWHRPFASKYY